VDLAGLADEKAAIVLTGDVEQDAAVAEQEVAELEQALEESNDDE
jgi:hypothetical protein